jgi:hypothetical protein
MRRQFGVPCAALLAVSVGGVARTAQAADPSTADCLAATEAALKSGNDHKLRAERSQLLVCAAASCPADIRKECGRRVEEVNPAIPTIIFEARDGAGNDLSAVKVTMDGEVLAERLDGAGLSIDPGEHVFVFETPGQPPLSKRLVIRESVKDRREGIDFGAGSFQVKPATTPPPSTTAVAPLPQAPSPPPAQGTLASESPPPETAAGPGLGSQKILGLVSGGVGVAGIAMGSVFGLMASSKWSTAKNEWSSGQTDMAISGKNDANSAATVSTVGFIAGGALLATGVVLFFTAPKTTEAGWLRVTPSVGPGLAGMNLVGRF